MGQCSRGYMTDATIIGDIFFFPSPFIVLSWLLTEDAAETQMTLFANSIDPRFRAYLYAIRAIRLQPALWRYRQRHRGRVVVVTAWRGGCTENTRLPHRAYDNPV
jgi:hypothetical protein